MPEQQFKSQFNTNREKKLDSKNSISKSLNSSNLEKLQNKADTSISVAQLKSSQKLFNSNKDKEIINGMENVSGVDLSGVSIIRNSSEPEKLNAEALYRKNEVHSAPGKDKHIPHELGHAVQQAKSKVKATTTINGQKVNNDPKLETEADDLGKKALSKSDSTTNTYQLKNKFNLTNANDINQRAEAQTKEEDNKPGLWNRLMSGVSSVGGRISSFLGLGTKKNKSEETSNTEDVDQPESEIDEQDEQDDKVDSTLKSMIDQAVEAASNAIDSGKDAIEYAKSNIENLPSKINESSLKAAGSSKKLLAFGENVKKKEAEDEKYAEENPMKAQVKGLIKKAGGSVPIVGDIMSIYENSKTLGKRSVDVNAYNDAVKSKYSPENLAKKSKIKPFKKGLQMSLKGWQNSLYNFGSSVVNLTLNVLVLFSAGVTKVAGYIKSGVEYLSAGLTNVHGIWKYFNGTLHQEREEITKTIIRQARKGDAESMELITKIIPTIESRQDLEDVIKSKGGVEGSSARTGLMNSMNTKNTGNIMADGDAPTQWENLTGISSQSAKEKGVYDTLKEGTGTALSKGSTKISEGYESAKEGLSTGYEYTSQKLSDQKEIIKFGGKAGWDMIVEKLSKGFHIITDSLNPKDQEGNDDPPA
tara:strand:- start:654 stop:2585 length:1932 start_codon:yes stop_codon:yes gene_type:complete